jgi:hypothetical protein
MLFTGVSAVSSAVVQTSDGVDWWPSLPGEPLPGTV